MLITKNSEILKNSIRDNNKITCLVDIKLLIKQFIHIPNEQRIRDDDKVDEIVKYQDAYYKNGNNCFNYLGSINIHCCKEDGINYLVDGQHRWCSMKRLHTKYNYNVFNVKIELVEVNTREELVENYKLINKNTQLPELPENTNKNIVDNVCKYFFNEYKKMWSLKRRNIRPKLNKNQFQEGVAYIETQLKSRGKVVDENYLKEIILDKNSKMSEWTVEGYNTQIRKIKHWDVYLETCNKNNMYLGMYNYINEEYCYDWVKKIIEDETGEKIKREKKNKKKRIPKKKRLEVWNENNDGLKAMCFCCGIEELNAMGTWECGHVISEYNGGDLSTQNLKPVCSGCNKSMATMNMDEYMKKYYFDRYNEKFNTGEKKQNEKQQNNQPKKRDNNQQKKQEKTKNTKIKQNRFYFF